MACLTCMCCCPVTCRAEKSLELEELRRAGQRWAQLRRVEKNWEGFVRGVKEIQKTLRRGEKRLWRVQKRWEGDWEDYGKRLRRVEKRLRKVETSSRRGLEELRRVENSWEELKMGEKTVEKIWGFIPTPIGRALLVEREMYTYIMYIYIYIFIILYIYIMSISLIRLLIYIGCSARIMGSSTILWPINKNHGAYDPWWFYMVVFTCLKIGLIRAPQISWYGPGWSRTAGQPCSTCSPFVVRTARCVVRWGRAQRIGARAGIGDLREKWWRKATTMRWNGIYSQYDMDCAKMRDGPDICCNLNGGKYL